MMTDQWRVDCSTPAVILKLDPNVFHHGGLGLVRSLGRWGVPVHVVHEDAWAPAAASRYVHGRWRWNPGTTDPNRIRDGLCRLAERIGRPAVLVATDDAGAVFLAEHGDLLRQWFLFSAPDADLPRRLAGKDSLFQLCGEYGFHCPETVRAASYDDALAFVDQVGLPVVAKLAAPYQRQAGSRLHRTTIVRTVDDLATLFVAPVDRGLNPLVLQEYLAGGADADWFFHAYCDERSACRARFTGVKMRSYPPHAGITTLGRTAVNERLSDQLEGLMHSLCYRGLADLDLRWDARTEQYMLLDFNPRIGAQFRLFQDEVGLDVARAAYLDLSGQELPARSAAVDRRFFVENYDLLAALAMRRSGELSLRTWARSLRGVDEVAWFARDDLAPFGLMCVRLAWRTLQWRRGGRMRHPSPQPPQYRPGRAWRAAT
jgi:D-aspartate ligase